MYKARLRLTFLYSLVFILIFWGLSLGLYVWFAQSLGEGYITKIRERHANFPQAQRVNAENETIVRTAGAVALEQLAEILRALNGGLLLIIPAGGWWLTRRTLRPIERASEQQRRFVSDASHEMRTPLIHYERGN